MVVRVLVGCPTSFHKEYCLDKYAEGINALTYRHSDLLLVDNSKDDSYLNKIKALGLNAIKGPYFEGARDRIVASRNILREKMLNEGYDYLLSLEQDVVPPKDIIERMLSHKKMIVSGIYFAHNAMENQVKLIPLVYVLLNNKLDMRPLNDSELLSNRLVKVVSAGLGCLLIHRDVLKDIKFRYDLNSFDDRWFFIDVFNKGIDAYADTSIKCKHYISNRPFPWDSIKK